MSTAYIVGFMKVKKSNRYDPTQAQKGHSGWLSDAFLHSVDVTSEDPWRMTRQHSNDIVLVLMSPEIKAASFDEAQKIAKEFAETSYPKLSHLFAWDQKR